MCLHPIRNQTLPLCGFGRRNSPTRQATGPLGIALEQNIPRGDDASLVFTPEQELTVRVFPVQAGIELRRCFCEPFGFYGSPCGADLSPDSERYLSVSPVRPRAALVQGDRLVEAPTDR